MSIFPSVAFLTGSVGTGEWIVLFVVILIVVGPKRLPEIARKIGRTMEMFRRAADEFKDQLMTMDQEPPAPSPTASAQPDADGVTPTGESGSSDPYSDAYPNLSDYPGNEGQVENWSSADSASENLASAPGGDTGEAFAAQVENAVEAPAEPASDSATDKPSEGGA